jgi:hypothetical protein
MFIFFLGLFLGFIIQRLIVVLSFCLQYGINPMENLQLITRWEHTNLIRKIIKKHDNIN